jgi:hypothetical protein
MSSTGKYSSVYLPDDIHDRPAGLRRCLPNKTTICMVVQVQQLARPFKYLTPMFVSIIYFKI